MRAVLTPDDLKRSDLIEPGWYPAELSDYQEKPAGTDKSTNCNFFFKILVGKEKGVTPKVMYNEKALGFGKNLWAIMFGPPGDKGYTGDQLSTDTFKAMVGKFKCDIYVARGESDRGNAFNDIKDFRPFNNGKSLA